MTVRTKLMEGACIALLVAAAGIGCNADTAGDEFPGSDIPETDTPAAVTFQALYQGYFQDCVDCHTPAGPGRTSDTEKTLDFSTVQTAYATLTTGSASGMAGNVEGCNGVPFLGSTYETSLVVATIDETVRATFLATGQGQCDQAAVTDMTLKVANQAAPSPAFLRDLKAWIDAGAPR